MSMSTDELDKAEDKTILLMKIAESTAEELANIPCNVQKLDELRRTFDAEAEALQVMLLKSELSKPLSMQASTNYAKRENTC